MATLRCGTDHYSIVSDSGFESDMAVYGNPCTLADEDTGDILFAFLDIPADDGTIRGAMGLGAVVYRLDLPDREEPTVVEDLPDGYDFEQDADYSSPFADDEDEDDDEKDLPNELETGQEEDEEGSTDDDDEPVPA